MIFQQEYTLKELDAALAAPKGTGFRRFKVMLPQLVENRDFRQLNEALDVDLIEQLRTDGRAYAQPTTILLLSADCFERLLREAPSRDKTNTCDNSDYRQ